MLCAETFREGGLNVTNQLLIFEPVSLNPLITFSVWAGWCLIPNAFEHISTNEYHPFPGMTYLLSVMIR